MSLAAHPPVWSVPASSAERLLPLADNLEADVAVVGAGLCGLVAAFELAAAGYSVIVLDAARPGAGASGINAGQVGPLFYGAGKPPAKATAALRALQAERLHRQVAASGRWLFDMIAALGIACEVRRGYVCAYRSEAARARALAIFEQWRPYGGRFEQIGRDQVADAIASRRYAGGVYLPDGGFLNPAMLVAGLVAAAVRAGIAIHPHSRVAALRRDGAGWRVESDRGAVAARQVLIAAGVGGLAAWPELARCVYPVPVGVAATGPLADRAEPLLPRGGPVADLDDKAIFAPAVTADGRLLVSFLMDRGEPDLRVSPAPARRRLARAFPEREIPQFESIASGWIGLTPDGLPRLIGRGDGLVAVTGCNGFGLTLGITAAREAARLILGAARDSLALPLTPPKPLPAARLMPALFRRVIVPLANRFGA